MRTLKAYLQLTRPANLVTALADILAGLAIAGYTFADASAWPLLGATLGLYGGGVVMNDVFDAELDAIERPERPIPSGKVSVQAGRIMGLALLAMGIILANRVGFQSGLVALLIALSTIVYNRWAKHHFFMGPLVMGLCRGGNLLLGMSIFSGAIPQWGWLAIVPIVYIGAITMISQDEVHGGKQKTLYLAAFLYLSVSLTQLLVGYSQGNLMATVPFVLLHLWLIGRPLWNALQNPIGPLIGKAVKAGVISLIVMNASWCMVFGLWPVALAVLGLLPISLGLAKAFAVT
ncbi:4-hydroxybenzoate polyprenyltransferase [Dyadobacter jejuensis]|uniref:4-hydroxybenzoate polyprenyltransferase n=1 Tax=Dyadobacter jejuensis TaxID=1082580 RepID=A0A316ASH8_9BACT|nr:UbiA-like protein EboC [Dyadobacter jejuensis]PWJ60655.1 4-hydroxybenzoate polyprenyltransferase [Dyadobacter jejuensis]